MADSMMQKGSRLAHLYGLSKTHKKKLELYPVSNRNLQLRIPAMKS